LSQQGKPAEGAARLERAVALWQKLGLTDSDDYGGGLTWLGGAYMKMKQPAKALGPLERALAVRTGREGQGDPLDVAETQMRLARALWDAGRDRKRAHDLATRARDTFAGGGEDTKKERAEADAWLAAHRQ